MLTATLKKSKQSLYVVTIPVSKNSSPTSNNNTAAFNSIIIMSDSSSLGDRVLAEVSKLSGRHYPRSSFSPQLSVMLHLTALQSIYSYSP
jgi:hypothetical protein